MKEGIPMENIIIDGLVKKFASNTVLDGVSFELEEGKITGLLGENGSGKTTIMKIICGLYSSNQGEIRNLVFKKNGAIDACCMLENPSFNSSMSALENLKYFVDMDIETREDFDYYTKKFRIDFLDVKFSKLSLGMKQKFSMIYLFLKKSKILLLDEITNGLDERYVKLFYDELKLYMDRYRPFVLISSHKIYELQPICDKVYIIFDHKIIKKIDIARNDEAINSYILFSFAKNSDALAFSECLGLDNSFKHEGKSVTVKCENRDSAKKLIKLAADYNLIEYQTDRFVLEKIYYELIGKEV